MKTSSLTLHISGRALFLKTIKKLLIVGFFFLFVFQGHSQTIAAWNATSLSGGGPTPWAATTAMANVTVGGLTRGTGLGTATAGSAWGANNWAGAANQDAYFTVAANAGYQISFSSLSMSYRRSGTGPASGVLQFAYGAAATTYTTITTLSYPNSTTTTGVPIGPFSLSSIPALQNVPAGTVVKFRIYNTGGGAAGTWYVNSANALTLNGSVIAVPSCTTPTGLTASNVGTNAADLDWNTIAGVSGYEYVIDQTPANPAGTGTAVTTNSYAASGLTAGTVYYAHVRTDCGGTFSLWATTSFTTASTCLPPTITAVTGNTAICTGQALNLSVTATGTALSYTWTGAGTFGSANNNTTTVTNPTGSDYTVSVSNACGTVSSAVTVTVNALPLVNASTASVCPGNSVTLTATGADTYTWSNSQNTASITVNPLVATSYTVNGTDLNGCTNSFTTSVAVYILPVVAAGSTSVCTGNTATLTATGATTYTWNTSQTTASITVNPSATTAYTVSGTDVNGCVNTFTTTVFVHALPVIGANSPSVCAGGTATLTATGANTYTWSTSQSSVSITVTPSANTTYTVNGTDLNGCMATHTTMVSTSAAPSLAVNSATVCAGGTATLMATGVTSYTWNTGANTASITASPAAATIYTVSGQLSGCPVIVTQTAAIIVNALPTVSITPISNAICNTSSTVNLVASPAGGTFSGTGISGNSFNPQSVGTGTFTISYTYTGSNSCSSTVHSSVIVSNCTGIEESSLSSSFNMYPNPAQDFVHLSFENTGNKTVLIYNTIGNLVYSETISEALYTIRVSDLSKGLYILQVSSAEGVINKQFLIQ